MLFWIKNGYKIGKNQEKIIGMVGYDIGRYYFQGLVCISRYGKQCFSI